MERTCFLLGETSFILIDSDDLIVLHEVLLACAYKWQLKFLCRVCMFNNKLAERLAHTVAASVLGYLVEMVVGEIKFITGLNGICSYPLAGPDGFGG